MSKPITDRHRRLLGAVKGEMSFYEIEAAFLPGEHGQRKRKRVYDLLCDLVESGDLVRVRRGVYAPAGARA